MKRNTEHLNKRILELSQELDSDLEINEMEVKDKSLRSPGLKSKWIQIYYEELDLQDKLEATKNTLTDKYTSEYGESTDDPPFMVGRKVAENADIKKLEKAIKNQQKVVRFLNDVNRNIWSGFGWDLRNVLDYLKLENN